MKKTAIELRNKAIMDLINSDLKLWPQQIVNIDLNHIRHQDEKVLFKTRNGQIETPWLSKRQQIPRGSNQGPF